MFTARHAVKNRRVSRFFFVFSSFEILLKVVGLLNREQVNKLVSKKNFSSSSNVNLSRVCRQISLGRLLAYRHKRPETLPVLIGQPDWSRVSYLFLFVIVHNSKQTNKIQLLQFHCQQRNKETNKVTCTCRWPLLAIQEKFAESRKIIRKNLEKEWRVRRHLSRAGWMWVDFFFVLFLPLLLSVFGIRLLSWCTQTQQQPREAKVSQRTEKKEEKKRTNYYL